MADATLYTDGSCIQGRYREPGRKGTDVYVDMPRGYGGYAAVVECGHDGWVVRGSVPATTSTAMELEAVAQGLRSLPDHVVATVHTDCTLVLILHERWRRHGLPSERNARSHQRQWLQLAAIFDLRAPVQVQLVRRRMEVSAHKRAHAFAQHEARQARLAALQVPVAKARQPLVAAEAEREARALASRSQPNLGTLRERLRHSPGCTPGQCVASCPMWLEYGYPRPS